MQEKQPKQVKAPPPGELRKAAEAVLRYCFPPGHGIKAVHQPDTLTGAVCPSM